MQKGLVDRERVLLLLDYYPETGEFRWRHGIGKMAAGSRAGKIRSDGYVSIRVDGRGYRAHRLAWLIMKGRWPEDQLDHINGCRTDNSILNLRECSAAENQQNVPIRADNSSGIAGAAKDRGRYVSAIQVGGKRSYLGRFVSAEEAGEAYSRAKAELHRFSPVVRSDK